MKIYEFGFRLRHNVIKTGIRMVCLSYSRISLNDIATKLCLDSADDAEFIVGKVLQQKVLYFSSLEFNNFQISCNLLISHFLYQSLFFFLGNSRWSY